MNFKDLLLQAKGGREAAVIEIMELYRPLLLKEALTDGSFDEDLYQELCITLLNCIQNFRV